MTKKTKIGIATIAAALITAVPFIVKWEGESLDAYRDVAGVWTICHGETLGVQPGDRLTREQCNALSSSRTGMFMLQIVPFINVDMHPDTLGAHTSFAYNIGVDGYKRSTALKLTNEGKIAEGCRAMANWYTAGGKDCRIKANRCGGLITRREGEIKMCLSGVSNAR